MQWMNRLVVSMMPLVPKALIKPFAKQYVAGETLAEMVDTVRRLNAEGCLVTVDVLGEFVSKPEETQAAVTLYKDVLAAIQSQHLDANISIKLSQMGLLLDPALCLENVRTLVHMAAEQQAFVRIDMEDSSCTTATLDVYKAMRQSHDNVGIVLQAYLRRSQDDLRALIESGMGHFRICKGIYIEPRALAYKSRELINLNYVRLIETCFQYGVYVGIATHDESLVWHAERLIEKYQVPRHRYEFQMLLGVDPLLRRLLVARGHRMRVYVPFGAEWYAYCLRRFKENPMLVQHVLHNLKRQVMESASASEGKPLVEST
jgi:proline dehydrogenase